MRQYYILNQAWWCCKTTLEQDMRIVFFHVMVTYYLNNEQQCSPKPFLVPCLHQDKEWLWRSLCFSCYPPCPESPLPVLPYGVSLQHVSTLTPYTCAPALWGTYIHTCWGADLTAALEPLKDFLIVMKGLWASEHHVQVFLSAAVDAAPDCAAMLTCTNM